MIPYIVILQMQKKKKNHNLLKIWKRNTFINVTIQALLALKWPDNYSGGKSTY